jgi:hypothetical protein
MYVVMDVIYPITNLIGEQFGRHSGNASAVSALPDSFVHANSCGDRPLSSLA